MKTNYQERPRKGGGTECVLPEDGGLRRVSQWRCLLPIAFTAENAQKVHDGKKTQTRRLIKLRSIKFKQPGMVNAGYWPGGETWQEGKQFAPDLSSVIPLARYRVGDVLWVQEPWRTKLDYDDTKPTELPEFAAIWWPHQWAGRSLGKLRPGRFLPLRFARPHRYEVVAVRCERVNEISATDCEAEGIACDDTTRPGHRKPDTELKADFRRLWNSIHSAPGTRFEDAPWVFAYTFKRIAL